MKKVFFFTLLVFSIISSYAQVNFEGVIIWNFTINALQNNSTSKQLSPKQKEELNKNIVELEIKLNDPNMKAMLDSNPSLKSMIEQQLSSMKAMQIGDALNNMFPKSYTIKLKDGNSLTQIEGGILATAGDELYLKSTDKKYYLKKESKTYSVSTKTNSTTKEDATYKVTPTTETIKILDYTCTKYLVTVTKNETSNSMFIWATKDLKKYDSNSFHSNSISTESNAAALKQIDGVPLKIEITEQEYSIIMEVTQLKSQTLPSTDFIIPADYKEVPYSQN